MQNPAANRYLGTSSLYPMEKQGLPFLRPFGWLPWRAPSQPKPGCGRVPLSVSFFFLWPFCRAALFGIRDGCREMCVCVCVCVRECVPACVFYLFSFLFQNLNKNPFCPAFFPPPTTSTLSCCCPPLLSRRLLFPLRQTTFNTPRLGHPFAHTPHRRNATHHHNHHHHALHTDSKLPQPSQKAPAIPNSFCKTNKLNQEASAE